VSSAPIGTIHHVELWVPDIDRAAAQWGWLLTELGYQPFQEWTGGCSWRLADTYIVIEQSPDMLAEPHDRKRPGLNHLAFHAGDQAQVDALTAAAAENGWALCSPTNTPTPAARRPTPPTYRTPTATKSSSPRATP
jgi:catechol 2,3-dioxygenase-like lactoylglutathione lyase family enzyme